MFLMVPFGLIYLGAKYMMAADKISTLRNQVITQNHDYKELEQKVSMMEVKLKQIEYSFERETYELDATAYTLDKNETDDDPWLSSFGLSNYAQIGISRDMNRLFRSGDNVLIHLPDGTKMLRVVNDRMNSRFTNRIDILFKSKTKALKFGKQKVTVVNLTRLQECIKNNINRL